MAYWDVVFGKQSWSDYITGQDQIRFLGNAFQAQTDALARSNMQIALSQRDYQIAVQSGLGALGNSLSRDIDALSRNMTNSIELGFSKVSGGIDELKADFNILMGDLIWKLEVQNETLASILNALQAPLDVHAKELRHRAEDAYKNGWYQEALMDFLESERLNYQDFAVHRSIANIYFYHLIDLTKSRAYYRKASKYARPRDIRQAAEAEFFAGLVCSVEQNFQDALVHIREACKLNSSFYEAHYLQSCFAALRGAGENAARSLETAINGDARYHQRAQSDQAFDTVRPRVDSVLDGLMRIMKQSASKARDSINKLRADCTGLLESDRVRIHHLFEKAEQHFAQASSYYDYFGYTQLPAVLEGELRDANRRKTGESQTLQAAMRSAEQRLRYLEDAEQEKWFNRAKSGVKFGVCLTIVWAIAQSCTVVGIQASNGNFNHNNGEILQSAFLTGLVISFVLCLAWTVVGAKAEPGKSETQQELSDLRDRLRKL